MYKKNDDKMFLKLTILILIAAILVKVFIPIIKPANATSEIKYSQQNFYKKIIDKSNTAIEVTMDEDDEDKKELVPMIFKYVTNIEIDNPRSYLAYQIPLLQFIDIPSLGKNNDEPVVVVPKEEEKNEDSKGDAKPNIVNKFEKNTESGVGDIKKIAALDKEEIKKRKFNLRKPLILIYHTHTTENYNPNRIKDQNFSSNLSGGVCKVGEELKNELQNAYGIPVIHDITIHDIPKRDGAYAKSRPTIQSYLKKYPSIKIVIDLHRDGDVKRNIETAIINDKRYARVMFVVGMKNSGYKKNLGLVQQLNNTFQGMYPQYCRGITYKKNGKYNQDLSNKIVLIEVGSNENSLDEAMNAAKVIAKVLAKNIK